MRNRIQREILARKQAERIIEEKSRELYSKSRELERAVAAEREARLQTEILHQALEAFTSEMDLHRVLSHLLLFLKSHTPHHVGAIYLSDGEHLRCEAIEGDAPGNDMVGAMIGRPPSRGMMGDMSAPIVVSGTSGETVSPAWGIHPETHTWLAVPMSSGGRNAGFVVLQSRERNAFGEFAVRLAQALSSQAAVAIENARLYGEVGRLAVTDSLTGLSNRRHLISVATEEFRRSMRYGHPTSVVMMDIDRFKRINDNHGHQGGDKVLMGVAAACARVMRSTDLPCRYGGEEFCIVLPETTVNGAYILAERLRIAIEEMGFEINGKEFNVTASFGVAERGAGNDTLDLLLERADRALYEAKRTGRNRVISWQPDELEQCEG